MDRNRRTLTFSCLISVLLLGYGQALAQEVVVGTLVRTTLTPQFSPPSSDPSGVAYDNRNDRLVVSDGEIEETTHYQGVNVFETTRSGVLQHTFDTTSFSNEPVGSAVNPSNGHYFFSDDDKDDIYEIDPGSDGMLGGGDDTRTTRDTSTSGNGDPEGLAYGNGIIFVSDGTDNEVYKYGPNGVTSCDTSSYVLDPEGLEFDPNTQTLYIVGKPVNRVFEITPNCVLIRAIDISAAAARKPAGLAIAPGSQANNSDTTYIYISERGRDAVNDGKLYEFAIPGGGAPGNGNQAPTVSAGADQAIDSSASCTSNPAAAAPCADIDGEVMDDGLPDPPGAVTTMWNQVSGPRTVTFGDPSLVDTTASFSAAGSYVLRLAASDSELSDSDQVTIVVQSTPPPSDFATIYVSGTTAGNVASVAFRDEDIIALNTSTGNWSLYFDGSDVGLGSPDVDAFDLMVDGSILFSLGGDGTNLPNVGAVDDSDIVRFIPASLGSNTAGTFEPYFDGSGVGLTVAAEDVDAIGFLPDGRLVISTFGKPAVTGVSGAADEDLLAFSANTLGANTSGTFTLYFDGSDVQLSQSSSEDVNETWIDASGGDIYLTTLGAFSVSGASGDGADIFRCSPGSTGTNTSCTYDLTFDGSTNGLAGEIIDGIELAR